MFEGFNSQKNIFVSSEICFRCRCWKYSPLNVFCSVSSNIWAHTKDEKQCVRHFHYNKVFFVFKWVCGDTIV